MYNWQLIQEQQRGICQKLKVNWAPVELNALIAFNDSLLSGILPINGLRHPKDSVNGWYLWSGGEIPKDDDHFFQPIHVSHLLDKAPIVLKYLGLPPGWRFQIDNKGYEDIWFDETILNI